MLDEAAGSRRRELQRRAYSPGGGLSEAERVELSELDARAAVRPVAGPAPVADPALVADPAPVAGPARVADPAPVAREAEMLREASASDDPGEAAASPEKRRRPGIPILVLATLVALLLGFGGGWMLLNRTGTPTMTADEASALAEIEKVGRFDPGSVVYLGEKYDASVWRATSQDGAKTCLAIHLDDQHQFQCTVPPDDADTPFAEPIGVSIDRVDGERHWSYWATLVSDISGRETLIVQRYDMSDGAGWESQFTEDELAQIDTLTEQGVDPQYLQVVGYDGQVPVFISQGAQTCVHVVDPASDAAVQSCEPDDDGTLIVHLENVTYEVRDAPTSGPLLTVVRNGG